MPLTILEWSVGLGAWIGLILAALLISTTYKAEPFALSVLPIAAITGFYIAIHIGILVVQLLLWTLSIMFNGEILASICTIILVSLITYTIQNTQALLTEEVD
jgi:hypothetical protein